MAREPDGFFRDSTARWDFDNEHACRGREGHQWQPAGIEFYRTYGGPGRCYVVCLRCGGHSYIETWWVGSRLPNAFDDEGITEAGDQETG